VSDENIQAANTIRILSAAMVEKAQSGHPGGPMGAADFMHVLFSEFLVEDPDDPTWPHRDRFFLDAGHLSPMLYSTLVLTGRLPQDSIQDFRQWGSLTPGHPERSLEHGIENTSGPLGQGHAFGIGAAIAAKFLEARFGDWMKHTIYCFISDGGVQEEISQGAGRIAGRLGLSNVVMFYDSNHVQLSTKTNAATTEDTAKKYEAWGWHVINVDGSDQAQIRKVLHKAKAETKRPTLIIGDTVMGKGALDEYGKPFEGQVSMHGMPMSKAGASFEKTVAHLGGDSKNPFVVPRAVSEQYKKVAERKRKEVAQHRETEATWRKKHFDQAKQLDAYLAGKPPKLDWAAIAANQKPGAATRESGAHVLGYFAEHIGNMLVMSADLANSDKTDEFLKKTTPIEAGDFSGAFLHCGVSEFTMAALAVGMALHGGVIPVCGTFFAFSDYMKPALRLAALMEMPVKFLWTHDAFRVGEDGPTHQPIEQEAQLRLLEKVKNHHGKPGFLVLRPADGAEVTMAWKLALENTSTPTGLILTRQGITDVSDFKHAQGVSKGAFIAYDSKGEAELVVVANGSEVGTAYEATKLLPKHRIRIVSVPSEGLFREQAKAYQDKILPPAIPRFGVTAGLGTNLFQLVGDMNRIHSLEHFGYSAPYKKLDEEFGFTPTQLAAKIARAIK
jgi:transketolase